MGATQTSRGHVIDKLWSCGCHPDKSWSWARQVVVMWVPPRQVVAMWYCPAGNWHIFLWSFAGGTVLSLSGSYPAVEVQSLGLGDLPIILGLGSAYFWQARGLVRLIPYPDHVPTFTPGTLPGVGAASRLLVSWERPSSCGWGRRCLFSPELPSQPSKLAWGAAGLFSGKQSVGEELRKHFDTV